MLVQNVVIELGYGCTTTALYGNRDNRDGRAKLFPRRLFQILKNTARTQELCCIKNTGESTDHLEKTVFLLPLPITSWTASELQNTPALCHDIASAQQSAVPPERPPCTGPATSQCHPPAAPPALSAGCA